MLPEARVESPKLKGIWYICQWVQRKKGPKLKCGGCFTGNVIPVLGDKCLVCASIVKAVIWWDARSPQTGVQHGGM